MMIEGSVPESIALLAQSMRELESWLDQTVVSTGDTR